MQGSSTGPYFDIGFDLFFPQGRVEGASIVASLAHPYPKPSLGAVTTTLDASLTAPVEVSGWTDLHSFEFDGVLDGPHDGLSGELRVNMADAGSDMVQMATVPLALCPVGDPTAPRLALDSAFSPTSPLVLAPSVPLEVGSLSVRVTSSGEPIEVTASVGNDGAGQVIVAREGLAFVPGEELTLDWTGTKDIIGRPVAGPQSAAAMGTTAVVEDLTFSTVPPPGAVTCLGQCSTVNGELLLSAAHPSGDIDVTVGLQAPAGATWISITGWAESPCKDVRAYVVGADGRFESIVSGIPDGAGQQPVEGKAGLPGGSAVWLVISSFGWGAVPQSYPSQLCSMGLDEIAFE